MLPALLAALTWAPPLLGLGALVTHNTDPALRIGIAGILGLAIAGVIGAWLNFWVALSPAVSACIWGAGLGLFVLRRKWLTEAFAWRDLLSLVLLLVVVTFAMRHPMFHYDTFFYHLQALKWSTDHSITPGIANVHYRLGFNSLWSLTAAATEHPFTAGRSSSFLNQLPILFGGQIALVALKRFVAGDRCFSNLMLAGTVFPIASATFGIGGLYVDYTASIVTYVALALWARALESGQRFAEAAAPAALLSLFAALLKISASIIPVTALVVLLIRRSDVSRRWWLTVGSLTAVAVVPWLARGMLISGCLVFPVSSTCFHSLPWAVPEEKTRSVAAWITSWARKPGPLQENWEWVQSWPERIVWSYPEASLLLFTFALGLVLWIITSRRLTAAIIAVFGMALAGALYWFLTAPEPRFALGVLFALGLTPGFAAASGHPALLARRNRLVAAATMLTITVGLGVALDGQRRVGTMSGLPPWRPPLLDWPELPHLPVEQRTTLSGLRLTVPIGGELCGAAPIPCTPPDEFNDALRFDGYFNVETEN